MATVTLIYRVRSVADAIATVALVHIWIGACKSIGFLL